MVVLFFKSVGELMTLSAIDRVDRVFKSKVNQQKEGTLNIQKLVFQKPRNHESERIIESLQSSRNIRKSDRNL